MYIIKYSGGDYESVYTKDIFVTNDHREAMRYVMKANKLLRKWKKYYKRYEVKWLGVTTIADEYTEAHYTTWYRLQNVDKCYFEEIELRENSND